MKTYYYGCSNIACVEEDTTSCPKKYKVNWCSKEKEFKGKIRLFGLGLHISNIDSKKSHGMKIFLWDGNLVLLYIILLLKGITARVKETIEEIVADYHIVQPKHILIRLRRWSTKQRHKFKIDIMPSLSQLQSYLKYQRIKYGN